MGVAPSNKILFLSDNHRIGVPLRGSLNKFGLTVEEENLNLFALDTMRKVIKATKNTTFLRTELFKFIQKEGYPFLIALDYTIDTGLDETHDPDKMKLLRTLLISYIILMRATQFENMKGNFILLAKQDQLHEAQALEKNPAAILDKLLTKDDKVNSFIEEFRNDNVKFMKNFFIKVLPVETSPDEITLLLDNYITAINARTNITVKKDEQQAGTAHDKAQREAAQVLYLIDESSLYLDGTVQEPDQEQQKLEPGQFYIKGYFTNMTQKAVSAKLAHAILGKLEDRVDFEPGEEIIIQCADDCTMDASTAASLAQLTGKELLDYKKILIMAGEKNMKILENSTGFSLIQKFIKPLR